MAMLVVEEDGVLRYSRVVHDRDLGTEGLASIFRNQIEALSQAIRDLITLPLQL